VLVHFRQRAPPIAAALPANLAAVADEVDVQGIVAVRRNEVTGDCVGFFTGCLLGNPAEALGHASDMRIYWECGQSRATVYGSCLSYFRVWNDR
jgi:hypothetical protein